MRGYQRTFIAGLILPLLAITAFGADQAVVDLYKSRCQGCHGAGGKGTIAGRKWGAMPFQDPEVRRMSLPDLVKIIKDGKNKMPRYNGKLTDDQIKEMAKYINELK